MSNPFFNPEGYLATSLLPILERMEAELDKYPFVPRYEGEKTQFDILDEWNAASKAYWDSPEGKAQRDRDEKEALALTTSINKIARACAETIDREILEALRHD